MKYIKITIIILFILIFTTGCTDLIKDPYSKEDRMKFQENITINYGKKDVDTTKFVTGYDSYSISDINRHKNSKTITIDNYTIKCPTFSANKMGKQKLVYKVNNYSYPLYVTVKDKEKPTIEYQKDIDYTIDDKISIKKLFIINDNLTKKENLKIKEELIKQMPEEISEEKYKFQGKFNQGIVSINLPQIAIIADENEEKFYQILDERLELCKEALMCRHYQLLGTLSDASPIIWQNGGISRLKSGEKIDKLLHGKYSNLSLGYIGTNEMAELIKPAESIEEKNKFIINVIKNLKETIEKWKKETDIIFVLDGHPPENVGHKFATKDKERYGTIKNVTDKGYYTN